MRFEPTLLPGAFVVALERVEDERGSFARTFAAETFAALAPDAARVAECSLAWNARRGTLRGLHYQAAPHEETKLVRCTRGAVHDVLVDLRPTSPAYRRWVAVELTAANDRLLLVPPGVAHGYLTLVDDTELTYQISTPYAPAAARGVRWDDPAFAIAWPATPRVISARDRAFPDFLP